MGDELDAGVAEEAWREQQRAVYSSGDTEMLARQQEPVALALVEVACIRAGDRVVDIGAGTGNVALAAARLGAVVTAVDLTPHQVEIGARRTADAGVEVDWHVADAEELPCPDGSVDLALSSFGVVYAARPAAAAAEMLRVLAPGGRALFTAYPADSFNGEMLELIDRYLPAGAGEPLVSEFAWAEPDVLTQWFPGRRISVERRTWTAAQTYHSAEDWWEAMREVPVVTRLRESLRDEEFSELTRRSLETRMRFVQRDTEGDIVPVNAYVIVRVDS